MMKKDTSSTISLSALTKFRTKHKDKDALISMIEDCIHNNRHLLAASQLAKAISRWEGNILDDDLDLLKIAKSAVFQEYIKAILLIKISINSLKIFTFLANKLHLIPSILEHLQSCIQNIFYINNKEDKILNKADLLHLSADKFVTLLKSNHKTISHITRNTNKYYTRHSKLKPDGSRRIYYSVKQPLKKIQESIQKNILTSLKLNQHIYGVKNTNYITCAKQHVRQKIILAIDIKDFFPSIKAYQIKAALKERGIPQETISLITKLITYRGRLPQGATTSSLAAALVINKTIHKIEKYILGKIKTAKISIYVDDLIISGPPEIQNIQKNIIQILQRDNFKIHPQKTKIINKTSKEECLGLRIETKIKPGKNMLKKYKESLATLGPLHKKTIGSINNLKAIEKINHSA